MKKVLTGLALFITLISFKANAAIYCDASSNISSYEWIESVDINGTPIVSGNNGGYLLHPITELTSPQINLTLNPGYSGYNYTENWAIWIDWNQDGIFDTSESVYSGSGAAPLNTSFNVPLDSIAGVTRMRIVMNYGTPEPCGTFTYGEVEDFPISIPQTSDYCSAAGTSTYYEWIDQLTINGNALSSGNNGGYFMHNQLALSDPTVTLDMQPGYSGSTYPENWRVWVDWNQDGLFDTTEEVYSGSGSNLMSTAFNVPDSAMNSETMMRVAMKYGGFPEACETFTSGEVEDIPIKFSTPQPQSAYTLSIGPDYTVYRNGPLDADLAWVTEKDGAIVLVSNATYSMSSRYYNLSSGSHFRVWLEDPSGVQVAQPIEYTVDETYQFQLSVDTNYNLIRSGYIGDSLQWVVEKDGIVVLQRNAANELSYTYYSNTAGSHIRVWLQKFIDGQYRRVSNYVEYQVGAELGYELSLDQSHRAMRTGYQGQPLLWQVEKDGVIVGYESAAFNLQRVDYDHSQGSTYSISLVKDDTNHTVVSNSVQYIVDDLPLTHTLTFSGSTLYRDGVLGESLTWVIEEDGRIKLERYASNELQFTPTILSGHQYRFWLKAFVNGGYQRISNIVIH